MTHETRTKRAAEMTQLTNNVALSNESLARSLGEVKVEVVRRNDPTAQTAGSESNIRIAALQVQVLDLEAQLALLSEAFAQEKSKAQTVGDSATRLLALEAEYSAAASARDAAGAVATAAVAELRELRLVRDTLLRERDEARSERDNARAAARAGEARITELESKLAALSATAQLKSIADCPATQPGKPSSA